MLSELSYFVSYLKYKYVIGLNKALQLIMKTIIEQLKLRKLAIIKQGSGLLLAKFRKNVILQANKNIRHVKYWKLDVVP